MSIGSGIVLFVIGAVLAFAVNIETSIVDLHMIGYILMGAGLIIFILGLAFTFRRRQSTTTTRSAVDPANGSPGAPATPTALSSEHMTRRHRTLRPRTLRRHVSALLERCRHLLRIDVPSSSDESSQPLRLQDSAESSATIVQSLFDAGSVTKGQTVIVDGHRAMTVELENGRIALMPLQLDPSGSVDPV